MKDRVVVIVRDRGGEEVESVLLRWWRRLEAVDSPVGDRRGI